jgi:ubiquinone/menaquinone biosynthesis C-methylase UbiE
MGYYERYIGPRLVSCLCGAAEVRAEREKLIPTAQGVVLEVGIGSGLNVPLYDPAHVSRVIGVDPHATFLKLGKSRRDTARVPVEVRQEPAEQMQLPSASVDTAVVTFTLCSVQDPARCLKEIHRVLRPGGRLLFLEHGLSREEAVARWQHWLSPLWRPIFVGCNLDRPVLASLSAAGFSIEAAQEYYLPRMPRPLAYLSRGSARKDL